MIGLTAPLLQTADGRKMGKTAAGAVWLSPEKLSPFDYWQFWRNSADADVIRFMKLFTELELSEIEEMAGQLATETGPTYVNSLKRRLADECTTLLHGADCLPAIHEIDGLAVQEQGREPRRFAPRRGRRGLDLRRRRLIAAEFAKSKGEARRLIKGGARASTAWRRSRTSSRGSLAGAEVKQVGEEEAALLVAK